MLRLSSVSGLTRPVAGTTMKRSVFIFTVGARV